MEFGGGSLSVNDGFLSGEFQKVIQVFFQFEKRFSCDYVKIGLISDFLDMNRGRDFVESVDKVVDFTTPCGFRCFRCTGVDHVAVKAA